MSLDAPTAVSSEKSRKNFVPGIKQVNKDWAKCVCGLIVMNGIKPASVLLSFSACFHHSDYHQGLLPLSLNHPVLARIFHFFPLMNCWAGSTSDPQLTLLSSWQIVIYIWTLHTRTHTSAHTNAFLLSDVQKESAHLICVTKQHNTKNQSKTLCTLHCHILSLLCFFTHTHSTSKLSAFKHYCVLYHNTISAWKGSGCPFPRVGLCPQ